MPTQIIYTPENPPTKGVAKKIWDVFVNKGLDPQELHYNGGRRGVDGSGTWACELGSPEKYTTSIHDYFGNLCGIIGKTIVYVQSLTAPYDVHYVGFATRKCPFLTRNGCSFPTMHNNADMPWEGGFCKSNCDSLVDDQLLNLAIEYEKVKE